MYLRVTKVLAACFLGSVLFIVVLSQFSYSINHRPNGFIRLFPPHALNYKGEFKLPNESYTISGITTDNKIYLHSYLSPDKALVVDHDLQNPIWVQWDLPKDSLIFWTQLKTTVNAGSVYMIEGASSAILKGPLTTGKLKLRRIDKLKFSDGFMLSSSTMIIRNYDPVLKQNVLTRVDITRDVQFKNTYAPEKQIDGVFCTDGILLYTPGTSELLYIYRYRNQFIRLDTNLTVLYKANTIDTTSRVKIKVAEYNKGHDMSMATPATSVNEFACASDKYLFVKSNLRANNENKKNFEKSAVIDVYRLSDGKYTRSLYLEEYNGKKPVGIRATNDKLIVLYGNTLVSLAVNF